MKLAVTGKGGVGKTTVSALLAHALQTAGQQVIAIDADPDSNLAASLGYADPDGITPLIEIKDLIAERTGAKPGTTGGMFKVNPRVDDIPEKYAVEISGVKVLVAGGVKKGGSGCYCPENAFVRTLVTHLLLEQNTALIVDMEAGIEHLSRGTVGAVDALVIVLEPGRRSLETAHRIMRLAADLKLRRVVGVGNKIRSEADRDFLRRGMGDVPIAGFLPYEERIRDAELRGASVAGATAAVDEAVAGIVRTLSQIPSLEEA
ncbi:MAG: AAA family ATPase [Kiritimatiellae bacterium]|nr:AAA family ATPase [Kiritimatiellia bacterium]